MARLNDNGDRPAHPTHEVGAQPPELIGRFGLTKREALAALAMNARIQARPSAGFGSQDAAFCVRVANLMLEALGRDFEERASQEVPK
jgi:hypothetical protein